MGMSSSQARLLSLTSRQHDVEWRAQKLQAEKLQLANDSDRVYNTYLSALNSTKIQTRVYNQWEGDTFKDATLAMLENGVIPEGKPGYDGTKEYASQPLFLQEISTGRLMITPEYAASIGVTATDDRYTGTLDDFLTNKFGDTHKIEITEVRPTDPATWPEDPDKVTSFNAVGNKKMQKYTLSYDYSKAVENTAGSTASINYKSFQKEITEVSATESISSSIRGNTGKVYGISSADDLITFSKLSKSQTAGNTFVLTQDIDMSGKSWTGMSDFAGTFNGNGHVIRNLTSNTSGLFVSTTSTSVISNVGLENLNIDAGTSNSVAGIAGNNRGLISNCFVQGNLKFGGFAGGIAGNNDGRIEYCNADINIKYNTCCVGGISGHNNADIISCNVTGTMNSTHDRGEPKEDVDYDVDWAGGLVGHNTGSTSIIDCSTGVIIRDKNGGAAGGIVIGEPGRESDLTIENVVYDPSLNPGNTITNKGDWGTTGVFKEGIVIPNVNEDFTGGLYSNLYAAFLKAGGIDLQTATEEEKAKLDQDIKNYIKSIYLDGSTDGKTPTNEALLKLANINKYTTDYLKSGSPSTTLNNFANALLTDINNGRGNQTLGADYQNQYSSDRFIASVSTTDSSWDPVGENKGIIEIPNIKTIRQNLISATKMAGAGFSEDQIDVFLGKYNTGNKQDLAYLAELNDRLYKYSQGTINSIGEIITCINSNNKFQEMPSIIDDLDHYTITMYGTPEANKVTETHPKLPQTETIVKREWDWEDPEVQQAVAEYNMLKGGFIIIGDTTVSEDYDGVGMHNSADWLTNVIQGGIAQFVTYNHEDGTVIGTSVANEVSLQEVQNTTYLNAAEATYERDMKKINKKETKIDTDLQKLEAERTSIKTEQDDLKKVIQDNVDLTFKLFS